MENGLKQTVAFFYFFPPQKSSYRLYFSVTEAADVGGVSPHFEFHGTPTCLKI